MLGVRIHQTYQAPDRFPLALLFAVWGCLSVLTGALILYVNDVLIQPERKATEIYVLLGGGASLLVGLGVTGVSLYNILTCCG